MPPRIPKTRSQMPAHRRPSAAGLTIDEKQRYLCSSSSTDRLRVPRRRACKRSAARVFPLFPIIRRSLDVVRASDMLSERPMDWTHQLFNRAWSSRSQTLTDNQTVRLSLQVLLRATPHRYRKGNQASVVGPHWRYPPSGVKGPSRPTKYATQLHEAQN